MSYDLVVWTRGEVSKFAKTLLEEGFMQIEAGNWEYTAKKWMITVNFESIQDEDIPDCVFSYLRGITHQVSLHVMPSGAPERARTKARRLARLLSEAGCGAVQDLQSDKVTLSKSALSASKPSKKPLLPEQSSAILSLDWCMDHSDMMTREGVNGLLDLLQRFLPEALPRRYGPYEPLRFKYAEMGRAHFVETYLEDPGTFIYCTRPAFKLSLPSFQNGYRKSGVKERFWANAVGITLDASLLDDPYWSAHLPKVFEVLSHYLRPFYGDARYLRGYEISRNGALLFKTRDVPDTPNGMAESSPVSPWWRGVPRSPGIACVIGQPYVELWPDRENWDDQDGLSFCQPGSWGHSTAGYTIPDTIAKPPKRITEIRNKEDWRRHEEDEARLPTAFPF